LLAATERDLSRVAAQVHRRYAPLRGEAGIGLAVGAVIDGYRMAKHFALAITDDSFVSTVASPRASHARRGLTVSMTEVDPPSWGPPGFRRRCSRCRIPAPPYSPEFRRQMVDLVRAGRDPADLAREFEPSAQAIRNWVAQSDRREGRREEKSDVLPAADRDELVRLRRENKQLRLERDILSRAAAWFARETGAVPSGSSNS
jgi:transposase